MTDAVILYILNKYDCTIYRLCKIIDELFFAYLKTSAGTVNPALKRLENLGCVTYSEKMSNGGMKSKIYSITSTGKKHLIELLLAFNPINPYHIINESKIALYISDILSANELVEFKQNMENVLELYKIKLENGIKNEYINLNDIQKNTIQITVDEVNKLLNIL